MDVFFLICRAMDLKQLGGSELVELDIPITSFHEKYSRKIEKTPLDKEGCSTQKRYNRINPLRRALALYGIG
ncbi:hypothetical protein [Sporosarcina sp. NPDC096371]|uniref:hypothetical protein n=1 Tax=Sporosarcina sp. NPDC096371 TaxID=3364530 RepID=UPI0037FB32F0